MDSSPRRIRLASRHPLLALGETFVARSPERQMRARPPRLPASLLIPSRAMLNTVPQYARASDRAARAPRWCSAFLARYRRNHTVLKGTPDIWAISWPQRPSISNNTNAARCRSSSRPKERSSNCWRRLVSRSSNGPRVVVKAVSTTGTLRWPKKCSTQTRRRWSLTLRRAI